MQKCSSGELIVPVLGCRSVLDTSRRAERADTVVPSNASIVAGTGRETNRYMLAGPFDMEPDPARLVGPSVDRSGQYVS